MRHRKHHFQLGRKKEHRSALMANLAAALLEHGRIQTTLPKAKALRPFVEKVISLAKKAKSSSPERAVYLRRLAVSRVRDRDAVRKLFDSRIDEFIHRNGGYTRIYKLGPRIGDAAELALIELIDASDEGYKSSRRKSRKAKRARPSQSSQTPAEAKATDAEPVVDEAPSAMDDSESGEPSEATEEVHEAPDPAEGGESSGGAKA